MDIRSFPHQIYFYGEPDELIRKLDVEIQKYPNPVKLHSRAFAQAWLQMTAPVKLDSWLILRDDTVYIVEQDGFEARSDAQRFIDEYEHE